MRRRLRTFSGWLLLLTVVAAALVATPAGPSVLRHGGWALVAEDEPVSAADAIVVAVDAGAAGVLGAADLVRRRVATRVAIFTAPATVAEGELRRRGVPEDDYFARAARQLAALGVERVERIAESVDGSESQGKALSRWCEVQQLRSVVVVTGRDHSARVRRILARSMSGHRTKVTVHPSRYSDFNPDNWWQTRGTLRDGIAELQKLLLDVVRHPLS